MTQASQPDRLDRVEALLAEIAERQELFQSQLEATKRITESNARSIEAESGYWREQRNELRQYTRDLMNRNFENMTQHQEFRESMAEFREELQRSMQTVAQAVADLKGLVEQFLRRRNGNG